VLRFAAEDPDAARLLLVGSWCRGGEAVACREGLLNDLLAVTEDS
jgi:hypothetical protein